MLSTVETIVLRRKTRRREVFAVAKSEIKQKLEGKSSVQK
jgi:hypothetical protein